MLEQAELAVDEADIIFFVYDAREGVTVIDKWFADWVRRWVLLVPSLPFFPLFFLFANFLMLFFFLLLSSNLHLDPILLTGGCPSCKVLLQNGG